MQPNSHIVQGGFNIIELLIATSIGLILLAGTLSVFSGTLKTHQEIISMARLEQELQAILSLITREIRRSGYNVDFVNNQEANKYFSFSPHCLRYTYDSNSDGKISLGEQYAFKFNPANNTIGFQERSNSCDTGRWNTLNDKNTLIISDLTFSQVNSPFCINLMNGSDCNIVSPTIGDLVLQKYTIRTSITGQLKNSNYLKTLATSVNIPNALIEPYRN